MRQLIPWLWILLITQGVVTAEENESLFKYGSEDMPYVELLQSARQRDEVVQKMMIEHRLGKPFPSANIALAASRYDAVVAGKQVEESLPTYVDALRELQQTKSFPPIARDPALLRRLDAVTLVIGPNEIPLGFPQARNYFEPDVLHLDGSFHKIIRYAADNIIGFPALIPWHRALHARRSAVAHMNQFHKALETYRIELRRQWGSSAPLKTPRCAKSLNDPNP